MAFNWSFKKKSKIPVDKSVLLATIFDKHLQIATDEGEFVSEDLAIEIVDLFRPADINKFEPVDISPLIDYLKANDTNQEAFLNMYILMYSHNHHKSQFENSQNNHPAQYQFHCNLHSHNHYQSLKPQQLLHISYIA